MPKLIDTNVLLAATASNPLSGLASEVEPPEPELRKLVFEYVVIFSESDDHIVLDLEGHIRSEYGNKMGYDTSLRDQDYGILFLQDLEQTGRINYVSIDFDHVQECAVLDPELDSIVSDRADKKWIAAAASHKCLYENVTPPVVYAAESDWYVIEDQLGEKGFLFERLLPEEWYQSRHQS